MRNVLLTCADQFGIQEGELSVLMTGDDQMRELNAQYRGMSYATDVLTFEGTDLPGSPLGEIIINLDQAKRQGEIHGHSLEDEAQILAIHGFLHVLGYDDEEPEAREEMLQKMKEMAVVCGVPWNEKWATRAEQDGDGPA